MKGFQLASFVESVPIYKIDISPDDPKKLLLYGARMNVTTSVTVNDIPTGFSIVTDGLIELTVPDNVKLIQSVEATSDTIQEGSDGSVVHFKLNSGCITGAAKTVQRFLKLLMTDPGSDAFHKTAGGGLLTILGASVDLDNPNIMVGHVATSIRRAEEQLISSQVGRRLSPDEKLSAVRLLDIHFEPLSASLQIQVLMTMATGAQAITRFGMTPAVS